MWYNRVSEYLLKNGYKNNNICPYVFVNKTNIRFAIVVVYFDNLNLFGTPKKLNKTKDYLKN